MKLLEKFELIKGHKESLGKMKDIMENPFQNLELEKENDKLSAIQLVSGPAAQHKADFEFATAAKREEGFTQTQSELLPPAATNDSDWISVNSADELVNKPADEVLPVKAKISRSIGNMIKFRNQSKQIQRKFDQIIKDSINLHSELIKDDDSSDADDSYDDQEESDVFQAPASKCAPII